MMRRWGVRGLAVAVAAGGAVLGAAASTPAGAASTCPISGACVYSGPNETGTQVQLPGGFGCHSAASLGLASVRSAVNRGAEQTILLFTDSACRTAANPAFVTRQVDNIDPAALSVRIRPLP
jgi:hypothetical protein